MVGILFKLGKIYSTAPQGVLVDKNCQLFLYDNIFDTTIITLKNKQYN